jgi:pyruvate dehydrogenase E1 component alpha subunit
MFEHVYATPHAIVDAEREWFAGYEASFADAPASTGGAER